MGRRSVTIATVRGIPIRLDATWVVIAALVTWSYWARFTDDHSVGVSVVMGLVAAALFFASVLAHELAHALEARRRGIEVRSITLMLFGGATEADLDARRPADQFVLVAVGPWTSLVLGAGFALVSHLAGGTQEVAEIAGLLGWTNVALGLFNLLPGAPLDGGRLVAAIVWRATNDRYRGAEAAGWAGQVLGALLVGAGFLQLFFVVGGAASGIWLAFIGWFLLASAQGEVLRARLLRSIQGLAARDLLGPRADRLPADAPVASVYRSHLLTHHTDLFPVVDEARWVGVVSPRRLGAVPPDARATTTVAEVMKPVGALPDVPVEADAALALDRAGEDGAVAVTENGEVVGILTSDVVRAVLQRARDLEGVGRW